MTYLDLQSNFRKQNRICKKKNGNNYFSMLLCVCVCACMFNIGESRSVQCAHDLIIYFCSATT